MKKRYLLLILVVLFGAGCWWAYNYLQKSSSIGLQGISLVPENATWIIETDEAVNNWNEISKSEPWRFLNDNKLFGEISDNMNTLDLLIKQNNKVFGDFGTRQIVISSHMIKSSDYDFLYIIDLQNVAKLNPLLEGILKKIKGYQTTKRIYNTRDIYELYDPESSDALHLTIVDNLMICSYTHVLVEQAIDQKEMPIISRDLSFIDVQKQVRGDGMFRLYIQYDYLDDLLNTYLDEENEYVKELSEALKYTGLGFEYNVDKTFYLAQGFTNTTPDRNSYLSLVQKDGGAKYTFPSVVSKRSAVVTSLNIDDFNTFYGELEKQMSSDEDKNADYSDNIQKIEKFLSISVKDNFISWIGEELAFVQSQPTGLGKENEYALFIKTNDIDDAIENLDFIGKQIKKRTPVKFKGVSYKDHEIKFLSVKGLFKVLMRSFFGKIEKPYYTVIENYVVFSNHPQTLKNLIDDYEKKEVLKNSEGFKSFEKNLNKNSSILIYVNTPIAYNNLSALTDTKTKRDLKKNINYFEAFPFFAMQISSEGDGFETKLLLDYKELSEVKIEIKEIKQNSKDKQQAGNQFTLKVQGSTPTDSVLVNLKEIENVSLIELSDIVLEDLDAKKQSESYENGQVKYEVGVKNGLKHGLYIEYSEQGDVIVKGKYKNDQKTSVWKTYNSEGDLITRQRY